MTFVLAIVKSILATQRNDFGFNKCELKSLNNVGYCGKKFEAFQTISASKGLKRLNSLKSKKFENLRSLKM